MPPLRRSDLARPFLKWAGGKTQLLPRFEALYPPAGRARRYIEPFVGSAAVFFQVRRLLRPAEIILADGNEDLIDIYREIQKSVDKVIRLLSEHRRLHSKEHYYRTRSLRPQDLSPARRAARFIYLNRTCFNGLYRVNRRGGFNVPMGRYRNPPILDAENLRNVARSLAGVDLKVARFHETLDYARAGDFIYLDPPYHPVSETSRFTSYTRDGFGPSDQEELAEVFAALGRRGCLMMLSNSDCAFIRGLYRDFAIHAAPARRSINSKGGRRGPVSEVVVLNYEAPSSARNPRRPLLPELPFRNMAVGGGSAGGPVVRRRTMRRSPSRAGAI